MVSDDDHREWRYRVRGDLIVRVRGGGVRRNARPVWLLKPHHCFQSAAAPMYLSAARRLLAPNI